MNNIEDNIENNIEDLSIKKFKYQGDTYNYIPNIEDLNIDNFTYKENIQFFRHFYKINPKLSFKMNNLEIKEISTDNTIIYFYDDILL